MAIARVLIVEDDPVLAMHLETLVGRLLEAEVTVSMSLVEAEIAVRTSPDIAVLDVDVTDGKSYEIASSLAKAGVPFAFVSASDKEELPSALRGRPFIAKPYDDEAIERVIETLLHGRRG